jgi:hypothetical protein
MDLYFNDDPLLSGRFAVWLATTPAAAKLSGKFAWVFSPVVDGAKSDQVGQLGRGRAAARHSRRRGRRGRPDHASRVSGALASENQTCYQILEASGAMRSISATRDLPCTAPSKWSRTRDRGRRMDLANSSLGAVSPRSERSYERLLCLAR